MNQTVKTSEFHLTRPRLQGPAERTLVEIRLSALGGQPLNTYTDSTEPAPNTHLTLVEPVQAEPTAPAAPTRWAVEAA